MSCQMTWSPRSPIGQDHDGNGHAHQGVQRADGDLSWRPSFFEELMPKAFNSALLGAQGKPCAQVGHFGPYLKF